MRFADSPHPRSPHSRAPSHTHTPQGSVGAWLYTDVAGIAQAPGTSGYASLLLWPRATTHAALPYASGSFESIRGTVSTDWVAAASSFTLAVTVPANTVAEVRLPFPAAAAPASLVARDGVAPAACAADAPENAPVTFTCPPGATVVNVTFASFGTPTGSCASGFTRGSCDAATSTAVVAAACVGLNACTINVGVAAFGDPCNGVVKHLDAQLACSASGSGVFYSNGAFVPGVPGVNGAWVNATTSTLSVATGSGSYHFILSGW